MKFEVKNRFSGEVQFTAEIECAEDASVSVKLGLAVRWAYKTGADLRDADLRGADLRGANLRGALKVDSADIPVIPNIDNVILGAIEMGGKLDMNSWHANGICGTTHCRAGWAVHLGGEKGKALEARFGPQIAGTLIYEASRPGQPAPDFYATDDDAMEDIRKCAIHVEEVPTIDASPCSSE